MCSIILGKEKEIKVAIMNLEPRIPPSNEKP